MTLLPLPSIEAVKNMEPVKANFSPFLFVKTFPNNSGFVWNEIGTWVGAFCSSSFYTAAFNFLLRFHSVFICGSISNKDCWVS